MKEIRQDFHAILNKVNKISVQAQAIVELAKLRGNKSLNEQEVRGEYKKALSTLEFVVEAAFEAAEVVKKLKEKVYDILKIDITNSND